MQWQSACCQDLSAEARTAATEQIRACMHVIHVGSAVTLPFWEHTSNGDDLCWIEWSQISEKTSKNRCVDEVLRKQDP